MSTKKTYIVKHQGKMEIHDYGSGLNFISKDEHGCGIDEAWIPTYRKHNGTLVHGHCRKMDTGKPMTRYELEAFYPKDQMSHGEWKEIMEKEKKNRREYRQTRRAKR